MDILKSLKPREVTAPPAPIKGPRVSARQMKPLFWLLQSHDVDVRAGLLENGYPAALLDEDSDAAISLGSFTRLFLTFAAIAGESTCYLSTRPLMPETRNLIFAKLAGEHRFIDALLLVSDSYNLAHGGRFHIVRSDRNRLLYALERRNFPFTETPFPDYPQFVAECLLMLLHALFCTMSGGATEPFLQRVGVARGYADSENGHLEFWRAPVKFRARQNFVCYDSKAGDSIVRIDNRKFSNALSVFESAISLLDRDAGAAQGARDFTNRVKAMLRLGIVEQEDIAVRLGVSITTLRRRLEDEGAGFREMRAASMNRRAMDLLAAGRSVADVAQELGYADLRSFNRAFKGWNGVTPKAMRAQLALEPISARKRS